MEFMTGVKTTDLLELAKLQNKELIGQTVKAAVRLTYPSQG